MTVRIQGKHSVSIYRSEYIEYNQNESSGPSYSLYFFFQWICDPNPNLVANIGDPSSPDRATSQLVNDRPWAQEPLWFWCARFLEHRTLKPWSFNPKTSGRLHPRWPCWCRHSKYSEERDTAPASSVYNATESRQDLSNMPFWCRGW